MKTLSEFKRWDGRNGWKRRILGGDVLTVEVEYLIIMLSVRLVEVG